MIILLLNDHPIPIYSGLFYIWSKVFKHPRFSCFAGHRPCRLPGEPVRGLQSFPNLQGKELERKVGQGLMAIPTFATISTKSMLSSIFL